MLCKGNLLFYSLKTHTWWNKTYAFGKQSWSHFHLHFTDANSTEFNPESKHSGVGCLLFSHCVHITLYQQGRTSVLFDLDRWLEMPEHNPGQMEGSIRFVTNLFISNTGILSLHLQEILGFFPPCFFFVQTDGLLFQENQQS